MRGQPGRGRGAVGTFVVVLAAAAALLVGCGVGQDPTVVLPPATTAAGPTPDPQWRLEVADFLDECARGSATWREARIDYPMTLPVEIGSTATYVATIDIRQVAGVPPPRSIPGPDPTSGSVFVQCAVAARLTTTGSRAELDNDDWVERRFTPSGVVDWSFPVSGEEIGVQEVVLELVPAVVAENGRLEVDDSDDTTATFVTSVRVTGGPGQMAAKWFEDNWPGILVVAGLLGAALIALAKWGKDLSEAVREMRDGLTRRRPEPDAEPAADDTPDPTDPPPPPPRRRRRSRTR